MADVWDGFLALSMSLQGALQRSLAASEPGEQPGWRRLMAEERAALEQTERNADGIPTHMIPAALPEDPDAYVEPEEQYQDHNNVEDELGLGMGLRDLQDQAYAESLLEDRRKRDEAERQEEEELIAVAVAASLAEEHEREARVLASQVPATPQALEPACSLAVRLPDGRRLERRFFPDATIEQVHIWLQVELGNQCPSPLLLAMDYPRRLFTNLSLSLHQVGWCPRAALIVLDNSPLPDDDLSNSNVNL